MRSDYDCIVVGAGPAGSMAAEAAARKGLRTLLLEKDREIGVPVRCAEGVGEKELTELVQPRERWIANVVQGAVLIAPNGKEVVIEGNGDRGLVLDRKIFDYDLAAMAAAHGAEIATKAYVFDVLRTDGRVTGVRVQHLGRTHDIRARVVIGADGVESRVGRFAGLHTALKLRNLGSCLQVTLANIRVDPRYVYAYFGEAVAPGGYLWIFPKSETEANVGIGILGPYTKQRSAMRYLDDFLRRRFPHAAVLYTVAGCVPVAKTLKKIIAPGLMLAGDAAHQVNPVTGGGIITAMFAGRLAGNVAAKAIAVNDVSENMLNEYAREWHRQVGQKHERLYRVKESIIKLRDADFNRLAEIMQDIPPEERTLLTVLKKALMRKPALILDLVRAFMG